MQQVFFKKEKRKFILLEVFIALLLFSIMIAPFFSNPIKSLKVNRDQLIKNELHRYKDIYLSQILKNLKNIDKLEDRNMIKLTPVNLDLEPLGTFCYNAIYALETKPGKKSNSSLVTIKLMFQTENKFLPKIKPYMHKFILENKAST